MIYWYVEGNKKFLENRYSPTLGFLKIFVVVGGLIYKHRIANGLLSH